MAKQGTFFDPTADIVNDLAEPGGDYDNAACSGAATDDARRSEGGDRAAPRGWA